MTDDIRRDEAAGRDGTHSGNRERSSMRGEPGRQSSPLGPDPQESSPLPGDPREAQEPQEPRSTHIGASGRGASGRGASGHEDPDHDEERGVVDQLKEAWDRMRGK
jgi:hypothetical protein